MLLEEEGCDFEIFGTLHIVSQDSLQYWLHFVEVTKSQEQVADIAHYPEVIVSFQQSEDQLVDGIVKE